MVRRRLVRLGLLLAVSAAFAGCRQSVDLGAVRALGKSADDAAPSFRALAEDYRESCMRRVEYAAIASSMAWYRDNLAGRGAPAAPAPAPPVRSAAAVPLGAEGIAGASIDALVPALTPAALAGLDAAALNALVLRPDLRFIAARMTAAQRAALDARVRTEPTPRARAAACASAAAASAQWARANAILVAYFDALADLAGGSRATDRYGVKRLAASLQASEVFNAAQTKAVGAFADDALGAVFDAKRRAALASYAAVADARLGAVVDALSAAADDHYRFRLRQENEELESFLSDNLILAKPGVDAFRVLQYANAWNAERKKIDARYEAASAYVRSLRALRRAHADLLASVGRSDPAAAYGVAKSLADEFGPDLDALRAAFGAPKP